MGVSQANMSKVQLLDDTDDDVIMHIRKTEGCSYEEAKLMIRVRNHIELCNFHNNF